MKQSHLRRSQSPGSIPEPWPCPSGGYRGRPRLEFVYTWLGLATIGGIPALINYTLRQESLSHTIQVAKCKAVICDAELVQALIYISVQPVDESLLQPKETRAVTQNGYKWRQTASDTKLL